MAIGTVAPPIGAVELSTRQPLDSLDSNGALPHCRAVEKLSTAVKLDSSTAAVEAVELSRSCRELSRIAVELSSRGSGLTGAHRLTPASTRFVLRVLHSQQVVVAVQNSCPVAGGHHSRIV